MKLKTFNTSHKTKKTPAGEIPVDWGTIELNKIVNIEKGKVPELIEQPEWMFRTANGYSYDELEALATKIMDLARTRLGN
ncbi:MAG: hypothetical protein WC955_00830 [Elusimicrobiota bacterium]